MFSRAVKNFLELSNGCHGDRFLASATMATGDFWKINKYIHVKTIFLLKLN